METLYIQVQPTLAPSLDVPRLRKLAEGIACDKKLVTRFQFNEEIDQIPYINITYETEQLLELWQRIRLVLYDDQSIGTALRNASIAVCERGKGWDNYLQLHHFDPKIALDVLDAG
jgi:hypothetical protein